ncbi:MAG: transcriptional repressor [Desulfobacterales bacterium]|jgi:Fur family ferric uptake transcriptional regulator
MCQDCNYPEMLRAAGLSPTTNRVNILALVGGHTNPLSARDIFRILGRNSAINRVTVYRILELLVENGLVERMSGGGRSFHFGLAPNENHRPHPHFYCRRCGALECLGPEALPFDIRPLEDSVPGRIEHVAVRVDGICKTCLGQER